MYITHVDEQGVDLVYRSTRQGFTHYLMGKSILSSYKYKKRNILLLLIFLYLKKEKFRRESVSLYIICNIFSTT